MDMKQQRSCSKKEDLLNHVCKEAIHWELLFDKIFEVLNSTMEEEIKAKFPRTDECKYFTMSINFFVEEDSDDPVYFFINGKVDKEGHMDTFNYVELYGEFEDQYYDFAFDSLDNLQNHDEFLKVLKNINTSAVERVFDIYEDDAECD